MELKSPEQVRRLIHRSRKPVVFRGLIDSWPMLKYSDSDWNSLFNDTVLECRVGNRNSDEDVPQWEGRSDNIKCTYSQLIKWSTSASEKDNSSLDYLDSSKHFLYYGYKYMKDIFSEEVLRLTDWKAFGYPERSGTESTFWLGTPGAHTPCHYDTYGCNLVAQVSGCKRWILYPPEDSDRLKPTRVPYEESSVYSRINFEKWSDTVPNIEGTHPHIVELCPGDVLLVPRHWWHHVRNQELSISINTWLELSDEDHEARYHESLVKFLVAHTSRNLSPDLVSELLNPNEEDVAYADLDQIQGLVNYSCDAALKVAQSGSSPEEPSSDPLPDETWIHPVVCYPLPDSEPEAKRQRSTQAKSDSRELNAIDIIRAFCHPRVIKTVSEVLQEELKP